jgi:hypothetical protein
MLVNDRGLFNVENYPTDIIAEGFVDRDGFGIKDDYRAHSECRLSFSDNLL